jgi:hypothetical protein
MEMLDEIKAMVNATKQKEQQGYGKPQNHQEQPNPLSYSLVTLSIILLSQRSVEGSHFQRSIIKRGILLPNPTASFRGMEVAAIGRVVATNRVASFSQH